MISKELENSHLSYFSVNLTDIFKISPNTIEKLSQNIAKKFYLLPNGDPQPCSQYFETFDV